MTDKDYMLKALGQARYAAGNGDVPVGAVLVSNDKIIASGRNLREVTKDATAHAEIVVIRKACGLLDNWRLAGTTLYVTLEPCAMCAGAIMNSRIARLVYGTADNANGAIHSWYGIPFSGNWNHKLEVTAGVLEVECRKILLDFFNNVR